MLSRGPAHVDYTPEMRWLVRNGAADNTICKEQEEVD